MPQSCYSLLSKYVTNVSHLLKHGFGNRSKKYQRVSVIYFCFTCPRTLSFPDEHNDLAQLEAQQVRFLSADILITPMDILGTHH